MVKCNQEVFKFQSSLIPRGTSYLVYNKDCTVMGEFPMYKELERLFAIRGPKFYAVGYHDEETGLVMIVEIIPEHRPPNW